MRDGQGRKLADEQVREVKSIEPAIDKSSGQFRTALLPDEARPDDEARQARQGSGAIVQPKPAGLV